MRIAVLADAGRRVSELEELPVFVEEYFRDLSELVEGSAPRPRVRDHCARTSARKPP